VAPGVAGNARLVASLGDAQQHHILVAVDADVVHLCTWPDSSPLNHSLPRDRLKYTARPSSAVFCRASRFIHANISTSPVDLFPAQ
jgi:hypothetical protein